MIREAGVVELGLTCATTCQSLNRGMEGGAAPEPRPPILKAAKQLTM